jgi:hypothetical protein
MQPEVLTLRFVERDVRGGGLYQRTVKLDAAANRDIAQALREATSADPSRPR